MGEDHSAGRFTAGGPSARSVYSTSLSSRARRAHDERDRGRAGGREGYGPDHRGEGLRPPQAVAQALPRTAKLSKPVPNPAPE